MKPAFKQVVSAMFIIFVFNVTAFSQTTFCKRNTVSDVIGCVVQTADGGYALGGYTDGQAGSSDFHIMKTDQSGNLVWAKIIGGAGDDWAYAMTRCSDNGLVIAGLTYGFGMGSQDGYITKVDSAGNLLWTRVIGGTNYDYFTSVIQTKDGGYVAAGGTRSFGAGQWDVYVVKFDAQGAVQWTRTVGGSGAEGDQMGTTIIQTVDDGFAIGASTISFDNTKSYDFYLIKLDANGSLLWTETLGGSQIEQVYGLVQADDGGYAIAGRAMSFSGTKFYLAKLDATGTIVWTRTATRNSNDDCFGMIKTSDGGYALIGRSAPAGPNVNYYDGYLVKFDASGTYLWSRTIGSTDPMDAEEPQDIIQTMDGGFAIAGGTRNFTNGPGPMNCYFVKLDASGNGCCVKAVNEGTTGIGGTNNLTGGNAGSGGTSNVGGSAGNYGSLQGICSCTIPAQPSAINGSLKICSGSAAKNFSITPVAGATSYNWSLPAGWSGTSTTTAIMATPGTSGVFTVTANNSCGVSVPRTVSVTVSPCTGIDENSLADAGIRVYPNPVKESLYLELNFDYDVNVINALGQVVYSSKLRSGAQQLDFENLAQGMYIVQLSNTVNSKTIKLIKE